MTDQNCRNCGAPLTRDGDCEYCGTQRQRRMTSGIEMTVDRITFFADDQAIGTCVTRNWPESRTEKGIWNMTTTQLIEKVRGLAQIGIVNAKEDAAILQEAADRLHELRAKADPKWYQWLIMDDGLFLVSIKDGESDWTEHKDDAMAFGVREEAEKFLDEHFMETGGGHAVLRGDVEACSNIEFFYDEN